MADGSLSLQQAPEVNLWTMTRKYGVENVMGRTLYYDEIVMFEAIDDIVSAYTARSKSENWQSWATQNPYLSRMLNEATKLAESYG